MNSPFPLKNNQLVVSATILPACFVAFSIVLPIRANALISVALVLVYFIYGLMKKDINLKFFKTPLFILIGIHLAVQLLGLLHSTNLTQGYADVERYFFALLFPFFIYLIKDKGVTVTHLITAFALGIITLTLYGIGNTIL